MKDIKDIPRVIKEAFHIATTGKPGPVVIDLPKMFKPQNLLLNTLKVLNLLGITLITKGHPLQIAKAVKMLTEAHRPVIISGGGVLMSDAHKELQNLHN